MSRPYLILSANQAHARQFAKFNKLGMSEYNIVLDPMDLKGYAGETTLLLLEDWDRIRSAESTNRLIEEMRFFCLRNEIRRMREDERIKDNSKIIMECEK